MAAGGHGGYDPLVDAELSAAADRPDPIGPPDAAGGQVVAVLVAAAALAVPELWLVRRVARVDAPEVAALDLAVVYTVLLSQSLLLLAPGVALGLALARKGSRRPWTCVRAASALVFAALAVDLTVASITGNHVGAYLRYLDEPGALQWGGAAVAPLLLAMVVYGAGAAALAVVLLGAGRAACRRAGVERAWGPLAVYALVLVAPALVAPWAAQPLTMSRVEEHLLVPAPSPSRSGSDERLRFLAALGAEADAAFARRAGALEAARAPRVELPAAAGRPAPDLLVVVAESLRRDALDPRWMPRLDAWAGQGLRLERHVTLSNCSHVGLFTLLYGQSPLVYRRVTRVGAPSALFAAIRAAGYRTVLASSAEVAWESMERYLSPANFDEVRTDVEGPWPERDRRTLRHVAEVLSRPGRGPVCVVAFLMSSHFDYPAPPGYRRHQPAAADGQAWTEIIRLADPGEETRVRWLNRYRNALGFVDDALADLLDRVDLGRTVVVVTGDHGESFGDDGAWLHSSRLSEAQLGVPCVLAGPGVAPGRRRARSSHLDLLPTLVRTLGGARPRPDPRARPPGGGRRSRAHARGRCGRRPAALAAR